MENVIDNPRGRIAVGIFFPFSRFIFHFFCIFAALFVPKPDGWKAGDRHIEKALSQRLICGVQNFATSKSCCTVRQWSMPIGLYHLRVLYYFVTLVLICNSVGFGIAYPQQGAMRRP